MSSRALWFFASVLAAVSLGWGCGRSVVGMPCSAAEPCPSNFDCAPTHDGSMRCAFACDYGAETICSDGSLCLPIGSIGDACYAGGTTSVGSVCSNDFDCVHGALCLTILGAPGGGHCFRACNYGEPNTCPGSGRCSPATGGGGYCP
jgi:hypothetical protein